MIGHKLNLFYRNLDSSIGSGDALKFSVPLLSIVQFYSNTGRLPGSLKPHEHALVSAYLKFPSNTARGGGIIMPIVMSLVQTLGSTPTSNRNVGKFLLLCGAHSNLLISSFFTTGSAPNPIIVHNAKKILGINFTFSTWMIGASAPGIFVSYFFHFTFDGFSRLFTMETLWWSKLDRTMTWDDVTHNDKGAYY